VDGGDEVEAKAVSFSAVAVSFGDDFESFEGSDDVFIGNALFGKRGVEALLLFGQLSSLGFFDRQQGVGVFFLRALIAGIIHGFGFFLEAQPGVLQQLIVMPLSFRRANGQNAPRGFLYDDLRLKGMALFLAGVETLLLFLGRSQGVSVASTRITSNSTSDLSGAFLPGT
jgi:hypothetical protein